MRQPDINRLSRAIEHVEAAIVHLEKVREKTEGWQRYRTNQHLDSLMYERTQMEVFLDTMKAEPDYQRQNY